MLSSEFLLPIGGLECGVVEVDSSFSSPFFVYTVKGFRLKAGLYLGKS